MWNEEFKTIMFPQLSIIISLLKQSILPWKYNFAWSFFHISVHYHNVHLAVNYMFFFLIIHKYTNHIRSFCYHLFKTPNCYHSDAIHSCSGKMLPVKSAFLYPLNLSYADIRAPQVRKLQSYIDFLMWKAHVTLLQNK